MDQLNALALYTEASHTDVAVYELNGMLLIW
jgi:hypothetical protein